jgi:4a-hydroxytetrahydrobiopterin dehydratase
MPRLSDSELARHLAELPDWSVHGGQLVRQFTFRNFPAAIAFVNRLAEVAEARQHHPDLDIRYRNVLIMLATHDEGGVTEKDTDLAKAADRLARESA